MTTNTSNEELYLGEASHHKVFFKAHITDFYDPLAPSKELGVGQPTSGVYHPSETITLTGFFLNNSRLGAIMKMTHMSADPVLELYSNGPCVPKNQFETSCTLPNVNEFTVFGEFMLSLIEVNTSIQLSDDHTMLVLLVLPKPVINQVTPIQVAQYSETSY